jgi:hypothetical protein
MVDAPDAKYSTVKSLPQSPEAGELNDKITPEMIAAGKEEVMSLWSVLASAPTTELYEEAAISIYRAMLRSRPRSVAAIAQT